jgi:hypothetical protein
VTVDNHLTSLGSGARNSRTHDQGIKTHFKKLNQVFTGQALGTTCLLEHALELCFTNAVLGAQTLLFAQTHSVVRVSLTLGAAVLPRRIRTLLEVFGCLWREGNAQGTRQAGLTAGT